LHESWRDRLFLAVFTAEMRRKVTPTVREASGSSRKPKAKRSNANRVAQEELKLEGATAPNQGRFGRTKATILDGEDLDIPTYIRRNLSLDQ